jgi:predicted NBD/HSP70 family sugar kinase
VARLAPLAGMDFGDMPYPEQLIQVQQAIEAGDERARRIYQTLGVCFGYAIAHYADFYEIRNLLVLGRVTSGKGGEILVSEAEAVLASAFPELQVKCVVPDEKTKRHGQAVAAASLPTLS